MEVDFFIATSCEKNSEMGSGPGNTDAIICLISEFVTAKDFEGTPGDFFKSASKIL